MMKNRLICLTMALLMLLMLLVPVAGAEAAAPKDATWFYPVLCAEQSLLHLLTDEELTQLAEIPGETVQEIVEKLFIASAGTEEHAEIKLWKTFTKKAEKDARSLENAAYRAHTLPFLMEAFAIGNRPTGVPEDTSGLVRPVLDTADAADAAESTENTEAADRTNAAPVWTPAETWDAFCGNEYGKAYLEAIAPYGASDADKALAVTQAIAHRWLAQIDHDRLLTINSHYKCWLYSAATPIDYPVVQCGNNDRYLDRLFNGEKNPAGTLFIDYRNMPDFQDPNTLMYGHHMRNSSMFHSLTDFETEGFFDAHPFMVIIDKDKIRLVELFSAYVTDSGDHCYDIAISDEADMRRFVEKAIDKSDFDAHVEIDCKQDHLVTMSTCAYHFDNARYIAIGRLDVCWVRPAE